MEEALSILWTYARRQPIESNGKTIVATISQSIAAIRIIMRLEGWLQKNEERESEGRESEKRKMMSEVPETKPSENLESGYVEEKNKVYEPFAQPQLAHAAESLQLVPTNDRACSTSILTESITFDRYELQSHASERATKSASTYLVAPPPASSHTASVPCRPRNSKQAPNGWNTRVVQTPASRLSVRTQFLPPPACPSRPWSRHGMLGGSRSDRAS